MLRPPSTPPFYILLGQGGLGLGGPCGAAQSRSPEREGPGSGLTAELLPALTSAAEPLRCGRRRSAACAWQRPPESPTCSCPLSLSLFSLSLSLSLSLLNSMSPMSIRMFKMHQWMQRCLMALAQEQDWLVPDWTTAWSHKE